MKEPSTKERIIATLKANPRTRAELAEMLGVKPDAIGFHLTRMKKTGQISDSKGIWTYQEEPVQKQKNTPKRTAKKDITAVAETVITTLQAPEQYPFRIRLLVAREAINDVLAQLDTIESTLFGHHEEE
jgi:DNA-binding transcriptional ArsR family regulator